MNIWAACLIVACCAVIGAAMAGEWWWGVGAIAGASFGAACAGIADFAVRRGSKSPPD